MNNKYCGKGKSYAVSDSNWGNSYDRGVMNDDIHK